MDSDIKCPNCGTVLVKITGSGEVTFTNSTVSVICDKCNKDLFQGMENL